MKNEIANGTPSVQTATDTTIPFEHGSWFDGFLPSSEELSQFINPSTDTIVDEAIDALSRFFEDRDAVRAAYDAESGVVVVRADSGLNGPQLELIRGYVLFHYGLTVLTDHVDDESFLYFPVA